MKERLKIIRKALSMSQVDFAKTLNITAPYVSMLEKGKYKLSLEKLIILSNTYEVNLNWIINGKGPMFMDAREDQNNSNNVPAREGTNFFKRKKGSELSEEEIRELKEQVKELQAYVLNLKKNLASIQKDNTHLSHENQELNRELRNAFKKMIGLQEVLLQK